jgi:hypothetical protein
MQDSTRFHIIKCFTIITFHSKSIRFSFLSKPIQCVFSLNCEFGTCMQKCVTTPTRDSASIFPISFLHNHFDLSTSSSQENKCVVGTMRLINPQNANSLLLCVVVSCLEHNRIYKYGPTLIGLLCVLLPLLNRYSIDD